jgi:hypothetical protein
LEVIWESGQRRDAIRYDGDRPRALKVTPPTYDVSGGLFAYTLPAASQVLLKASCSSGTPRSAYVKSIVSNQPRVAGPIIEIWNGFDETGKIFMPDKPGFRFTLEAHELPTPTLIVFGGPRDAVRAGGSSGSSAAAASAAVKP